jgi:glycosyltransferase involved in cell wall biosynthesis
MRQPQNECHYLPIGPWLSMMPNKKFSGQNCFAKRLLCKYSRSQQSAVDRFNQHITSTDDETMDGPLQMTTRVPIGRDAARTAPASPAAGPHPGDQEVGGAVERARIGRDSERESPLRILLTSRHRYPAGGSVGTGTRTSSRVTGGASIIHDLLAKGLAELGHEVSYHLEYGHDGPSPEGVRFVDAPPREVDIHHYYNSWYLPVATTVRELEARGVPWIVSCHIDGTASEHAAPGHRRGEVPANWVVVSRTLARLYNHRRCVLNGVDPSELAYSASKDDYLLFVSRADAAEAKGIGRAIELSRDASIRLVVMASTASGAVMDDLGRRCRQAGAEFVGDVRGTRKAELFAGARALLFPTQLSEAFGLVIAEALMSGTPVIASRCGACPELVTPEVGFVCETRDDYRRAIEGIGDIRPEDCRARAMDKFHYLRMAREYVREYRVEIENRRVGKDSNSMDEFRQIDLVG